jgi:hypothetical protein
MTGEKQQEFIECLCEDIGTRELVSAVKAICGHPHEGARLRRARQSDKTAGSNLIEHGGKYDKVAAVGPDSEAL